MPGVFTAYLRACCALSVLKQKQCLPTGNPYRLPSAKNRMNSCTFEFSKMRSRRYCLFEDSSKCAQSNGVECRQGLSDKGCILPQAVSSSREVIRADAMTRPRLRFSETSSRH